MKGLIIYKSTYGSTKQYAEWLSEETGFTACSVKKMAKTDLKNSDVLIIGCPVIAFKHLLASWVKKNWESIKDKTLILYTTSGALPIDEKLQNGFKASFSEEMRTKIHYFPQGGRIIIRELKPFHRMMLKVATKIIKDSKTKGDMLQDVDNVSRAGINPILEYIRKQVNV